MYTTAGEVWRAPLGTAYASYHVALDAARVVVRTRPGSALRAWSIGGDPVEG